MRRQLEEMRMSRNLQSQPLPFPTPVKAYLEAAKFWTGPPDWDMHIGYRVFIELSVPNIGSGPAVAINFDPELRFERKSGIIKIGTRWQPIDSMREGATKKIEFMFVDRDATIINNALYDNPFSATMNLVTLFKNVLGGSFKSEATYLLNFSDEDVEKLKSWLKVLQTAKIDYAKEIELFEKLVRKDEVSEANDLIRRVSKEFQEKARIEDMPFEVNLWEGSFSVTPLTEEQYKKEVVLRGGGTRAQMLCREIVAQKSLQNQKKNQSNSTAKNQEKVSS